MTDNHPHFYRHRAILSTPFYCRGYMCSRNTKQGVFKVSYRPKKANYWLPRKFVFKGPKEDLEDYIEALVFKSPKAADYEAAGHVSHLVYTDPPAIGTEADVYHLSPTRLQQVLLGNDPLALPETCGITFTGDVGNGLVVPKTIISYLVSQELWNDLASDIDEFTALAEGRGCTFRWRAVRKAVHAELIPLHQVLPDGTVLEEEELANPEQERLITRKLPNQATETIYRVYQYGQTYYGREITYEGMVIYRGTSNSPTGPWETVEACLSSCAILGLDIEAPQPAGEPS